jgi:hypothetical protein
VALLCLSLLVGLAFLLSRFSYAVFVWTTFVVLAAVLAAAAASAWREWIPRRSASIVIDHRAQLEDRLATLTASPPEGSRLWGYLLSDNLRLLPRWTPEQMVPHAIPRTLWLLVLSILLTLGVLRWAGVGATGVESAANPENGEQEAGPQAAEDRSSGEASGGEGSLSILSALPEKIREAILGSAAQNSAQNAEARGDGRLAGGRPAAQGVDGPIAPGRDDRAGQGLPRQGKGEKGSPSGEPPPQASDTSASDPRRGSEQKQTGQVPELAFGDSPKALPPVESGRPRDTTRRPSQSRDGRLAGKGGGAQGAGSGGDRQGLMGPPDAEGKATGSFPLDLTGARSQMSGSEEGDADFSARPASDLAADQRLDDAIRRAQVPPEYEQIIQRIFSHADTTEESELGTR